MSAERVLILYQGGEPDAREINQLVKVIEREHEVDLVGVRVTAFPAVEPAEALAQALVLRLEKEGRLAPDTLRRMTAYTVEAAAGRRVVAVTWADETNAWVRRMIPARMAKVSGLARRAGWVRLATEPALAFVASARDGDGRRFPEVHVVVSVLPEARPRRVRRLMGGGYLTWVDGVLHGAGVRLGEVDVAHWLVCGQRTVHLAYLATDAPALLPRELLSRAEKRL